MIKNFFNIFAKNTPKSNLEDIIKHYFSSVTLYGLAILIVFFNSWLSEISDKTQVGIDLKQYFLIIYLLYIIIAPILLFIFRPFSVSTSENTLIFKYLKRFFINLKPVKIASRQQLMDRFSTLMPENKELQAIVWYFSRVYFIPIMLIGAIESLNIFHNFYTSISIYIKSYLTNPIYFTGINKLENLSILKNYIFLIIFFLSTFIEMVIYVVSYSITVFSRVKSVDISPLGIMSCLLCYIPLKKCIDIFINPFPENMQFIAETAYTTFFNWIICIIIIFSSILSICSTTSLFLKISNFTNRGIVTKFPYNIIRHPLYASRIICIWASVLFIVILKTITIEENLAYIFIIIGALAYGITYTILYYYRAITEERHLYLDDDYKKYCKKVKYRFIPKFW